MKACFIGALAVVVGVGCGDDRGGGDRDGGSGMDSGTVDAGPPPRDSGPRDAGPPGDSGGDSGAPECRVSIDCPRGYACVDRRCTLPPGDCCETDVCPPGLTCNWDTCGCIPATGCCAGELCPEGSECDFESCSCYMIPVCDPPCMPGFTCDWGICYAECAAFGIDCPDGLYCDERMGCVPAACSDADCLAADMVCDPATGCYDPCTEPGSDWSWCTSMGGRCFLGGCVDDACTSSMGEPCTYVFDRCGEAYCQLGSDPPPPDPPFCDPSMPPEPVTRTDTCVCGFGGCEDLRHGGGGVIIVPPGGDGGGGTPGRPPEPPPPPPP